MSAAFRILAAQRPAERTARMHLTAQKVNRRVEELATLRFRETQPIGPLSAERLTSNGISAPWSLTLSEGDRWGERDEVYLMRLEVPISEHWRGKPVVLQLHFDRMGSRGSPPEGLLLIDGQSFHAIDLFHREVELPRELTQRGAVEFTLRLWTGLHHGKNVLEAARVHLLDVDVQRLHTRMRLMANALTVLAEDAPAYVALLRALDDACLALDFRQAPSEAFSASCRKADGLLAERWAELGRAAGGVNAPFLPGVTAVGHAHIDVAWMWRLRHTRIKAANTFSTTLYHMDLNPAFRYIQSQPQLYQFVKEDQPDLYARIKAKVAEGQWEPEGAMWVEADTNITGGESLVRQFLVGKRFFREEFGHDCRVLWLPDVFGYTAALPQLMRGAGVEYFITAKISWNETNRFPYDTFWWEGIDGSRVLTQYLTTPTRLPGDISYTYNADLTPASLAGTWKVYQQKAINSELLIAYGFGDGGGGPTRQQVDALLPLEQPLAPDVPAARPDSVEAYMDRLAQQLRETADVPRWVGELYLEYHRGTYTSQARVKRANRLSERGLHEAEWLASMALYFCGQEYPSAALDEAWKLTLLNHFHDVLPGSSIAEVYQDALEQHAQVAEATQRIAGDALAALARHVDAAPGVPIIFNAISWTRDGLVEVDGAQAASLGLPSQDLDGGRALVRVARVPAYGYRAASAARTPSEQAETDEPPMVVTPNLLESRFYRIELNERGQITRLLDKQAHGGSGREVLLPGARANVLHLFEDRPLNWDAWDINEFYEQKSWELDQLVGAQVIEQGPLRGCLQLEWSYLDRTTVVQRIYLYAHTRRIDFATEVYWRERRTLLKVSFPVDVHNDEATAEIQFGNITRPTHKNTTWDRARFETCAHKWFDISEGDYGVALLNDCKYGYDVHDSTLRLTLLKGAVEPDPTADLGLHHFTYSLLPHDGDWLAGQVPREAYDLNYPLLVVARPEERGAWALPPALGLVEATPGNVVVETVKRAENSNGLVVRVYECGNRRGQFKLRLPFPASAVEETNLLEEHGQAAELSADGRVVLGTIRPYEIKTFVIQPRTRA
jgi:alpha-mannosidase